MSPRPQRGGTGCSCTQGQKPPGPGLPVVRDHLWSHRWDSRRARFRNFQPRKQTLIDQIGCIWSTWPKIRSEKKSIFSLTHPVLRPTQPPPSRFVCLAFLCVLTDIQGFLWGPRAGFCLPWPGGHLQTLPRSPGLLHDVPSSVQDPRSGLGGGCRAGPTGSFRPLLSGWGLWSRIPGLGTVRGVSRTPRAGKVLLWGGKVDPKLRDQCGPPSPGVRTL